MKHKIPSAINTQTNKQANTFVIFESVCCHHFNVCGMHGTDSPAVEVTRLGRCYFSWTPMTWRSKQHGIYIQARQAPNYKLQLTFQS